MRPPHEIDNARVLRWAWSGATPFGVVEYQGGGVAAEIYGLAICQYVGSDDVYRFSCDAAWQTQQDDVYGSVGEAIEELPQQYKGFVARWNEME